LKQFRLSDGEHFVNARIRASSRSKDIALNTLIKVNDYNRRVIDNQVHLDLKKVTIVSQDPGYRFGNPLYYYDVYEESAEEDDGQSIVNAETPIENEISQDLMETQRASIPHESEALLELYSCTIQPDQRPVNSKIPRTGWLVDSHGESPGPKCRWIPAQKASLALPTMESMSISTKDRNSATKLPEATE